MSKDFAVFADFADVFLQVAPGRGVYPLWEIRKNRKNRKNRKKRRGREGDWRLANGD
jgi:hypothetical protein